MSSLEKVLMTDLSEFWRWCMIALNLMKLTSSTPAFRDWIRSDAVRGVREQKSYTNGTFENDRSFKPQFLIEGPSYTYVVRTQLADDGSDIYKAIYTVFNYWRGSHSKAKRAIRSMGNLLPLMPFCLPPITRRKEIIPRPAEQGPAPVLAAPRKRRKWLTLIRFRNSSTVLVKPR